MATYRTAGATCERCISLDGKPIPAMWRGGTVGNHGRIEMGHQMMHTSSGRTTACLIGSPLDELDYQIAHSGVGPDWPFDAAL